MASGPDRKRLHARILQWYRRQGRELPWRDLTDPYPVLVSEVMLQQTQVSRVLLKFPTFMALFPSLRRLAGASQRDVVRAWQGMGYNNRAVRLHRLAQLVVENHGGNIPDNLPALRSFPGVGKYTAHAMMAFAFRKRVPLVDINVRRVLSRVLWRISDTAVLKAEEEIWEAAHSLLPSAHTYEWNQALMDLGATICTARAPKCPACPVNRECRSSGRIKRSSPRRKRPDPSRKGVPNRVYRGRIVETLRSRPRGLALHRLGRLIADDFQDADLRWLSAIVAALADDGLVRVKGVRESTCRVSLI